MEETDGKGRPASGMRGRVTRRQAAPGDAGGADDGEPEVAAGAEDEGATWKQEIDAITNGTSSSRPPSSVRPCAPVVAHATRACRPYPACQC